MHLTLCTSEFGVITWYVNASYPIHGDCRGHTGAMMIFGGGAITSFFHKQKINVQSSREAKLIGVDTALLQILWTIYFLEEQIYR